MAARDDKPAGTLLADIHAVVGDSGLLIGDDVRARPVSWLDPAPCRALAIVRPADTAAVSQVMSLCAAAGQAVVPLGGNTGLVDGTLAAEDEILLSLERMNTIEAVDTTGLTMTVQAGVPLQRAQEAAADAGLMFPLDLGGRGSATIGGNISTNAGGNSVIRWGMMREQVLGLEAVLADGTVISSMNRMLKNNAGYDLKQLFIGTEGTLGIVTRAVLRLRPALGEPATAFVAFDDFSNVASLLRELDGRLGGTLSAFEVMWADFYDTVIEPGGHTAPVATGQPYYALIEARGGASATAGGQLEDALADALERGLIVDASIAQSGAQHDALWAIRDDIDTLKAALDPVLAFDVSLPLADAEDYAARVNRRLGERWPDAFRGTTFGHLGDGNLHFLLTIGTEDEAETDAAMQVVYDELRPHRGSVSAEHGVGLEKRPYLDVSRSNEEIDLMRRLKAALDPAGILNPGKIFD